MTYWAASEAKNCTLLSGEDSSAVQCPIVIWLQSHCLSRVLPPPSRFVRPVSSAVGRAAVVLPGPADSLHSTQCLQQQRPTINTASVTLYTYLYIHSEGAAYRWQLRVDLPKHVHQKVGVLGDIVTCYVGWSCHVVASWQLQWTLHWCTGAGAGAGNTQPGDNTSKQEDINRGCDCHIVMYKTIQFHSLCQGQIIDSWRKLGQRYYKGLCVILYTSKPRL